ncbi:MAG TPA: hypothetical protein QF557_17970 [Myxococcota bacterium]|nr:hypothetical protein [Myxococcota bacterium]
MPISRQAAVWVAAACGLALVAAADARGLVWRRVDAGAHGEAVGALSFDVATGRLAVGGTRGLRLGEPGAGFRRVLHRGPVRDVAFVPSGGLLAATPRGVFEIDGAGRAVLRAPAPGAAARDAHRVYVLESIVAVATRAGVFVSSDAVRWRRVSRRWPVEPARTVALRAAAEGIECWGVIGGHLWSANLRSGPNGLVDERAERHTLPVGSDAHGPVDVVFDVAGADVVTVLPAGFAVRDPGSRRWREVRPALPPGASAQRLVAGDEWLWLATDRGLLVADALEGPWRRAAPPVGTDAIGAIVSQGSRLYVAAGDGVLTPAGVLPAAGVLTPAGVLPAAGVLTPAGVLPAAGALFRTPEGDPPIEHIHRVVLAAVDLESRRIADLRHGVRRRGWLPLVSLRLSRGEDKDDGIDRDEAFLYGETRLLVDRERKRSRGFETSLTFAWDLGDIAYHPEEIDVSREAREVVKLRDDVLDEVNQLYFERRRVLAELSVAPPGERLHLQLRAAELAAGIDAWTGGWFSRARAGYP